MEGKVYSGGEKNKKRFSAAEFQGDNIVHIHTRAHAEPHSTQITVVRTLLSIRHVSVPRRSIIDLNTQRQLL